MEAYATNSGPIILLNRQLNLRQPVLNIVFIPDAVDVTFPMVACHLITILRSIAVDVGIGFTQSVIGTLVVDADGLGRRQNTEADPFVADPIFLTAQSYRNLSP